VLLRRSGDRYQLVAGERRWRAARLAGLETIPALVRELSDKETLELSLTENLLRQDLNPLEVARAYSSLLEQFQLNHEEIAARLGLKRATITNTLRLLRLAPGIQEMIARGELSAGHARALLGLESAAAQAQMARLIVQQGLSVRQVEDLVALRQAKPSRRKRVAATVKLDPNTRAALLELERTLGTRVRIVGDEKRGKIEISYFSAEDLNRIYEIIVKR
jgi:ParB family chromosome partitioning protein